MFRLLVVVLVVHRVQDGVGVLRELREREREIEMEGERKRENVVVSMEPAKRNKEPGVLTTSVSHTRGSIAITLVVMTVVVLMAVIVIDVNPRW